MVSIWLNWFENKEKYNIKDFKFIDLKNKKELLINDLENLEYAFVNKFEINENYRMLVNFHNIIKENKKIKLKNKKFIKYFDKNDMED